MVNGINPPSDVKRNNKLYKYLLNNNLAYYFSSTLNMPINNIDKCIVKSGAKLNDLLFKTIKCLNKISHTSGITYSLFKTKKWISEVVDGDVDLIVKNGEFSNFITLLQKEGFRCFLEEPLKAVCTKPGFCRLEPRVEIGFHGLEVTDDKKVWKNTQRIFQKKLVFRSTNIELDASYFILSLLYGPNYLKLYQYKVCQNLNIEHLLKIYSNPRIKESLKIIWNTFINEKSLNLSFPLFLPNLIFFQLWLRNVLPEVKINLFEKIRIPIFFLFIKYKYLVFGKLHFQHHWYE